MKISQKILIVDDRKENLVALRQVLSEVDAEIVEAKNGNDALTATLAHDFSLAILDVQMPVMDGYELAELLRGDPKTANLPVIFVTAAYGEEIDIFRGYEAGAVDYIVKPYNPAVLLAKVRVFLDLQAAKKELARRVLDLSASEERYRTLVTTIPDIVYRIDTEGRFTFLNDAVQSLGYHPEELMGRPFSEIVFPADIESVSRRFVLPGVSGENTGDEGAPKLFDERRTGSRKTIAMEVRLVSRLARREIPGELHSSGQPIIAAEVNSSGLYADTAGGRSSSFVGTVGIIRDITKRKAAEAELNRYQQGLENLVEEKTVALKKRVGEIDCLYGVSSLFAKPSLSVDEALKSAVELIPQGYRYPETARARIVYGEREFASNGFRETMWRQSADIVLSMKVVGTVEVCYLAERSALNGQCFLKEEQDLIDELARQVTLMIERKRAHARLEHINGVLRSIRNVNRLIVTQKQRTELIQTACEKLVHTRRSLKGAWIVLTGGSTDRAVGAQAGFDDTHFSELMRQFQRGETPECFSRGQGESGANVVVDRAAVCRDCPLAGDDCGMNGGITIELNHGDHRYGYMGIAVPTEFINDEEETSLFVEIAGDIAFALASIGQEQALKEAERRYRTIFEGGSEGILVADAETGRFRYCNPALCEMLGYSERELLGLGVQDIHPTESMDRIMTDFEAMTRGESRPVMHLACLRKDGCVIHVDVLGTGSVIDDQRCIVAFYSDVTKEREMEEQLRQSQKMEAVGTLASGVAHDFNNLLTTVIGNSDLILMDTGKDHPLYELVDEIKNAGKKASVLTRQLLAFSRKQILRPEVVNLNSVVEEMGKMIHRIIGEDISLGVTDLDPGLGKVEVDVGQMEQVIMNLCANARDAMPKGGCLTIETKNVVLDEAYANTHMVTAPGPYVMLAVSDTGTGMTRDVRSRLFEPFFTTKEKGKGTGLGLSTVYGIVKQSKGNIWVYSEPEKGSTFKIYLPRIKKDSPPPREAEIVKKTFNGSETVLLVEDDEMVTKMVVKVLKKYGYHVFCAPDGEEALRILREQENVIHLVLTDVVMPGMSGGDLADEIRKIIPDLKMLFTSGYTDNAIVHHGVLDKGIPFIQKPFTPDELARKVREVLGKI